MKKHKKTKKQIEPEGGGWGEFPPTLDGDNVGQQLSEEQNIAAVKKHKITKKQIGKEGGGWGERPALDDEPVKKNDDDEDGLKHVLLFVVQPRPRTTSATHPCMAHAHTRTHARTHARTHRSTKLDQMPSLALGTKCRTLQTLTGQ